MYDDDKIYFSTSGAPKRCTHCECTELITEIKAVDGGYASEVEIRCSSCNECLGYRAYGNYDPCFIMSFLDTVRS